ncbi:MULTISPECIES: nuclear transport factor 2 family protein [Nocardioides]|uniref:SnoaL-like domain-containing protein n=1 Tax=Nocardioides lianchengensis TaxID=1045774 RepID=A0A1G7ART2_9ACTN|nr:nuclear transport factor 2 family protein [Nocardioides lianchengensis]NYG13244.1 3-phenylpropionate/cinnamic acid dioxygenase small subunit [Nocardioides lianchengensis]SDE16705.1 SnoaL-like domain-containing protein [Nocardioides lianchengensis]
MTDSAREIEDLLLSYAERIDAGDFAGVGALFAHGTLAGQRGSERVQALYEATTRRYDDGTPLTHHAVTNLRVRVDEEAGTAVASSYFTVTQATPTLPLQVVVTGRYADTFRRRDDGWWFDERVMHVDQVGDVSQHLLIDPALLRA